MTMLPIQPAPFFASKNRAFWNLQLAGWGGAFLLRAVTAITNGLPFNYLVLILATTITGFSISLVLSVIYRQLIGKRPLVTWGVTALVLFVAVIVYGSIDVWAQSIYYGDTRDATFAQRFIGLSFIPLTLLGGWSALYYAINFFLTVERQADRLERLEAQATAAQLAMLRYQLNPHFLFNTLNSISTLVLLKQTEPANAMLTRLSGFLRHTLITQPGSQVTLEQEIETLQLYLDIERMRFEERLRTEFEIEEAALGARLPSMLLQPLIENSIKYAVGAQEEGARISLSARVIGQRLRLTVEDSGPGADLPPDATRIAAPVSTGVGLANIRNRLVQAYGDAHLFETRSPPGGGFIVLIEIPFVPAREAAPFTDGVSEGSQTGSQAARQANPAASSDSDPAVAPASRQAPLNPHPAMGS
ncbi:MAG: histidine kinase [Erythrobacter sp.]|nr:histidine kinase [Erythrobacter sp.]